MNMKKNASGRAKKKNDQIITYTTFEEDPRALYTCGSPSVKSKTQINYIVNKSFNNAVLYCKTIVGAVIVQ